MFKQLIFYISLLFVMPYLTMLVNHHMIGGFLGFIAEIGALVCIVAGFVLAQAASIATIVARLARKLFGSKRSLDAPPTTGEKLFYIAGPFGFAVTVYTTLGIILSFWAKSNAGLYIAMMVGLGLLYGALMAWGLLSNMLDPHDMDAVEAYPDSPGEAPARKPEAHAKR